MRASMYAGVSTALAAGVVVYAFNQRPNFYSACVFLSQSNLSVMILINLCFLVAYSVVWALSRLLYGPLRPIEVEQLYERGWFAVTETCLAMTIFRDEIGAWFIAMFVALMAGRVWGWIGHGRVEMLEQQPPANPRSFHTRLILSLAVSLIYDFTFVSYAAGTVYEQARPNMMVMFLFEYVLLTIATISTALRYLILVVEIKIQERQLRTMLEAKREEVRERREEILAQRQAREDRGETAPDREEPLPNEDDVDEMDVEPPGWEAKGQMILILDLLSDFMRLLVYLTFFAVLTTFFGLPIHIMRDLFVTSRSFIKRLTAMLRYRSATRDMNAKYPDATQEEIAEQDTCIICREDMKSWSQLNNPETGRTAGGRARPLIPVAEKNRSKKLPCGHILHMGCLKGWLERQQVCPTCRAPVGRTLAQAPAQPAAGAGLPDGAGGQAPPANPGQRGQQGAAVPNNGVRGGMINFGPLRVAYGRAVVPGNADPAAAQEAARHAMMARVPPGARVFGLEIGNVPAAAAANRTPLQGWRQSHPAVARSNTATNATNTSSPNTSNMDIGELIRNTEQRIMEEAEKLELQREDLNVLRRMQLELSRLRTVGNVQRTIRQHEQEQEGASLTTASPATATSAAPSDTPAREPAAPLITSWEGPGNISLPGQESERENTAAVPATTSTAPATSEPPRTLFQRTDSRGMASIPNCEREVSAERSDPPREVFERTGPPAMPSIPTPENRDSAERRGPVRIRWGSSDEMPSIPARTNEGTSMRNENAGDGTDSAGDAAASQSRRADADADADAAEDEMPRLF